MIDSLKLFLSTPVDAAPVALFRLALGLIICWSIFRKREIITLFYTSSPFYITYEATPFIRPYGKAMVIGLIATVVISSFSFAIGLAYPYSAYLFFLSYAYLSFMDKSMYNNHYYLAALLIFLYCVIDGGKVFAADTLLGLQSPSNPQIPYWHLLILQLQFAICYTWGGINKINKDWLLRGQPTLYFFQCFEGTAEFKGTIRRYCLNEKIKATVERIMKIPTTAYVFCYGGLFIDLFIIWLLLHPVARPFVLPFYLAFNLFNHWFFQIGYFPFLNYAAIILFLDAKWSGAIIDFMGGWL